MEIVIAVVDFPHFYQSSCLAWCLTRWLLWQFASRTRGRPARKGWDNRPIAPAEIFKTILLPKIWVDCCDAE